MKSQIILNDTIEVIVHDDDNNVLRHNTYVSNFAKILSMTLEACPRFETFNDMFSPEYELEKTVYKSHWESAMGTLSSFLLLGDSFEEMPFHQFGGSGYDLRTQHIIARVTCTWAVDYVKKYIPKHMDYNITGDIANDNLYRLTKNELVYKSPRFYDNETRFYK